MMLEVGDRLKRGLASGPPADTMTVERMAAGRIFDYIVVVVVVAFMVRGG